MRLPAFVRLSVCLWARLLKTRGWIWMKGCVSTDVGTWNWLTFEPDPDYSPDAWTGLLSPISYALQRGILLRRENPTYAYWRGRSMQRGVILKWFYSPRAVGTPLSEVHALYTECLLVLYKIWGMRTLDLNNWRRSNCVLLRPMSL